MEEKSLQLVTILATKLGVTVERLWSVLTQQAIISAVTDGVTMILWMSMYIYLVRFSFKEQQSTKKYYNDKGIKVLLWAGMGVVTVTNNHIFYKI